MFGVVVKASLSTSISCSETNIMMRRIIRLQLINTASPFKKTPKIIMVSKIEPELIKNWEEIKKLWPIWTKSLDWILTILRPIISEVNNIVTREESKTLWMILRTPSRSTLQIIQVMLTEETPIVNKCSMKRHPVIIAKLLILITATSKFMKVEDSAIST